MTAEIPPLYRVARGAGKTLTANANWHPPIDRLLAADYAFLGYRYEADGCLFRGLPDAVSGLAQGVVQGPQQDQGGSSLVRLERRLGVVLTSNELADALAVARPWSNPTAAILVLPATCFNTALGDGRAAVLGFAEGGQVFKYPFFCRAPAIQDIRYILAAAPVCEPLGQRRQLARRLIPLTDHGADRQRVSGHVERQLSALGVRAAKPIRCKHYPRLLRA